METANVRIFELFGKGKECIIFICTSTKNLSVKKRVREAIDGFETTTRGLMLTKVGVHPWVWAYACGRFGDQWDVIIEKRSKSGKVEIHKLGQKVRWVSYKCRRSEIRNEISDRYGLDTIGQIKQHNEQTRIIVQSS